jgi:flavorubredoxin
MKWFPGIIAFFFTGSTMKTLIVYYSMYGHVYSMARAVLVGVRETLSQEALAKMGAIDAQKAMAYLPVCTIDELVSADSIILGTPVRNQPGGCILHSGFTGPKITITKKQGAP